MKRLFLSAAFALLAAFSVASAPANAGTITLLKSTFSHTGSGDTVDSQQLDPGSFVVSHVFGSHNTSFVDTFKIAVVGLKTALNFDIKTLGYVSNMSFNLYDSTGGGTPLKSLVITSASGDPTDTYVKITGALLATIVSQPFVILKVTGAFCGCSSYSITATPLPASLIMLLTSLGGLGLVGLWRSKGQAPLRAA
jgi:hypothetical protein